MSKQSDLFKVQDVSRENLIPEVTDLMNSGARLMYASGVDRGVFGFQLDYHFCFDDEAKSRYLLLRALVKRNDPTIPSLTPITTQADWAEREIIEFLGVKVEDHPDPRHLWLPLNWDDTHAKPDLEQNPESKRINTDSPKKPPSDHIFIQPLSVVPYGPYHPALIESNFLKMSVEDETVIDADLKLGFNHRSIIKLMERRDYYKDIYLSERICGFCNVHHTLTFVMAVENILGIEIPQKANYIRTLLGELERMKSHLLAIGLLGELTGFKTMLMHSLRLREEILDSLEVISGQRISHGAMTLGGVKIDITPVHADFIRSRLKSLKASVSEFFEQYLANDILIDRLKNVGHLSPADARTYGAVGPLARGSGHPFDVRKQFPYAAYEDVSWEVITENGADSLARLKVRMREFMVALDICEQCCDILRSVPSSSPIVSTMSELPCGEGVAKTEPPRGELLYHVASNGTNTPEFVRLRVPTFPNAPILLRLIKGGNIADVPVVIGSIDPCFSCTDRATVVQANKEIIIQKSSKTNENGERIKRGGK